MKHMKIELARYDDCTGCGVCKASCARGAICFDYDKNGHLSPIINHNKCVACGLCLQNCPVLNDERLNRNRPNEISNYTAWSNNNDLCMHSTSGGIFAQMAVDFINKYQGYVYGAQLSDYNTCEHIEIKTVEDIRKIVGTKYIQSDASKVYKSIRDHLLLSEPCLFSGTPCQVAGLYSYLHNIVTDKLYTIELICHGVPSKYITDLSCQYYQADHILSYRNKKDGWKKGFSCTYVKSDGKLIENQPNEFFSRRFGILERPSCYKCKYARVERIADITIGDQWGLMEKYNDRKKYGASLVICNNKKGQELLGSSNIVSIQEENKTLNAPTIFAPMAFFHLTTWIYIIKKLPLKWQYSIATLDYRNNYCLIPLEILARLRNKMYKKSFAEKIRFDRERLGWK